MILCIPVLALIYRWLRLALSLLDGILDLAGDQTHEEAGVPGWDCVDGPEAAEPLPADAALGEDSSLDEADADQDST